MYGGRLYCIPDTVISAAGGRAVEVEFSFSSRCAVAQRFLLVSAGRAGQA